jgi:hypothetical protein
VITLHRALVFVLDVVVVLVCFYTGVAYERRRAERPRR